MMQDSPMWFLQPKKLFLAVTHCWRYNRFQLKQFHSSHDSSHNPRSFLPSSSRWINTCHCALNASQKWCNSKHKWFFWANGLKACNSWDVFLAESNIGLGYFTGKSKNEISPLGGWYVKAKRPSKGLASDKLRLILLVVVTLLEPILITVEGERQHCISSC